MAGKPWHQELDGAAHIVPIVIKQRKKIAYAQSTANPGRQPMEQWLTFKVDCFTSINFSEYRVCESMVMPSFFSLFSESIKYIILI